MYANFLALKLSSKEKANATDCLSEVKTPITQLFCLLFRTLERNTSNLIQNVVYNEKLSTYAQDDHKTRKHFPIFFLSFLNCSDSFLISPPPPPTSKNLPSLWILCAHLQSDTEFLLSPFRHLKRLTTYRYFSVTR